MLIGTYREPQGGIRLDNIGRGSISRNAYVLRRAVGFSSVCKSQDRSTGPRLVF